MENTKRSNHPGENVEMCVKEMLTHFDFPHTAGAVDPSMLTQFCKSSEICLEPKFSKCAMELCDESKCHAQKLRLNDADLIPEDDGVSHQMLATNTNERHCEMMPQMIAGDQQLELRRRLMNLRSQLPSRQPLPTL